MTDTPTASAARSENPTQLAARLGLTRRDGQGRAWSFDDLLDAAARMYWIRQPKAAA
jgi:hypothetical protein